MHNGNLSDANLSLRFGGIFTFTGTCPWYLLLAHTYLFFDYRSILQCGLTRLFVSTFSTLCKKYVADGRCVLHMHINWANVYQWFVLSWFALLTLPAFNKKRPFSRVFGYYWLTISHKPSMTKRSGGRLNKKDGLTRYGDSHVKDKTSYRPSYLKHGNRHT